MVTVAHELGYEEFKRGYEFCLETHGDIDTLLNRITQLEKVIEPWANRSCTRLQMNPDAPTCRSPIKEERRRRRDWCQFCTAREALYPVAWDVEE